MKAVGHDSTGEEIQAGTGRLCPAEITPVLQFVFFYLKMSLMSNVNVFGGGRVICPSGARLRTCPFYLRGQAVLVEG